MTDSSLQRRLLEHIQAPDYRPAKPSVIARQLKLDADERQLLKRLIKKLVKQKKLVFGPRHLVLPSPMKTTSGNANAPSPSALPRSQEKEIQTDVRVASRPEA